MVTLNDYLAVGTTAIIICTAFVAVRCSMAIRSHGKLLVDDYLSISGLLLITITFAMNHVIYQKFTDPTTTLNWLVVMSIVITVVLACTLWSAKAPILFLFVKIFGVRRWLRYACYATLSISALTWILALIPTLTRCPVNDSSFGLSDLPVCIFGSSLSGIISSCMAIAVDITIFFLPIGPILALKLPLSRRLGVILVFCLGILGIVTSAAALYYKVQTLRGQTTETLAAMLCTLLECTTAIIVGCAPAVTGFWNTIRAKHQAAQKSQSSGGSSRYKLRGFTRQSNTRGLHDASTDRINGNYVMVDNPPAVLGRER